ncbi:hypothetical protein [Methylobacterium oxalidis]|uniref:hypothetical protein n=1 Tax=Methylobacterium oxalidis TaxID=944322 RepID=UPI0011BDE07F|nr:hypothetical protein [Methylobacterium oxalidis]
MLLAILLAGVTWEYLHALGGSSCGLPAADHAQSCYPWGAEGPAADRWEYASKETYLRSTLVMMWVFAAALVAPLITPGMWSGLGAVLVVLVLGLYRAEWLASLF